MIIIVIRIGEKYGSEYEDYLEKKDKGILLWAHSDKLIYALAVFLESETITVDEIKEFLLNNPETWN